MIGWAPIPGWEGHYEAHPDGRVRSLPRLGRRGRELSVVVSLGEEKASMPPLSGREFRDA